MEKDLKRDGRPYGPQGNDSREDYQGGRSESMERAPRPRRPRMTEEERRVYKVRPQEDGGERTERPRRPRVGAGERREYVPRPRYGEGNGGGYRPRPRYGEEQGERPRRPRFEGEGQAERPRRPRYGEGGGQEGYRPRPRRPQYGAEGQDGGQGMRPRRPRYGEGGEQQEYGQRGRFEGREGISEEAKEELRKKHYSKKKILAYRLKDDMAEDAELRLNRYIAMSGICSRRDADELIQAGRVKVNGVVVDTVGMKVKRSDEVVVDDVVVEPEKKVYIVLNKPKGFVTTMDDPLERKTVMGLVEKACRERIFPVGRLDRMTTGVLLFTNDGELAKKLTHPSYDHKKIYHVFLDRALEEADREAIARGVELEDGVIRADEIEYTSPDGKAVGIEIHSGKNRIVRRIFEHLGYQVVKLDRVYFAGITKKRLPRGKWRYLTIKEVNMLKAY